MYNKISLTGTMIPECPKKIDFAEKLEISLQQAIEKGEPIKMDRQIIFTDAKDGVIPEYDIRTDKFDKAIGKIEKTQQAIQTKMQEAIESNTGEDNPPKE